MASLDVVVPYEPVWSRAVYHLYVIRIACRDVFLEQMGPRKIGVGIHYPVPLHLQNAYRPLKYTAGAFPVTESVAQELVSLSMFPQLTAEMQETVVEAVAQFLGRKVDTTPQRPVNSTLG